MCPYLEIPVESHPPTQHGVPHSGVDRVECKQQICLDADSGAEANFHKIQVLESMIVYLLLSIINYEITHNNLGTFAHIGFLTERTRWQALPAGQILLREHFLLTSDRVECDRYGVISRKGIGVNSCHHLQLCIYDM